MQDTLFKKIVFTSLLFLLATHTPARAQGYEGLIPPESPAPTKKQAAPGYEGVVPGTIKKPVTTIIHPPVPIKQRPVVNPAANALKEPQVSLPPGMPKDGGGAKGSEDLKIQAYVNSSEQQNALLNELAKDANANKGKWTNFSRFKVEGLDPMEYSAKSQIDRYMGLINDKNLPAADRKKIASMAYKELMMMADGIVAKKKIPDSTYERAGMPADYIAESKAADDRALERLREAFKTLRTMQ